MCVQLHICICILYICKITVIGEFYLMSEANCLMCNDLLMRKFGYFISKVLMRHTVSTEVWNSIQSYRCTFFAGLNECIIQYGYHKEARFTVVQVGIHIR